MKKYDIFLKALSLVFIMLFFLLIMFSQKELSVLKCIGIIAMMNLFKSEKR